MTTKVLRRWNGHALKGKPVTVPVDLVGTDRLPLNLPDYTPTIEAVNPDGDTVTGTVTVDPSRSDRALVNFANSETAVTGEYQFDLLLDGEAVSVRVAFTVSETL